MRSRSKIHPLPLSPVPYADDSWLITPTEIRGMVRIPLEMIGGALPVDYSILAFARTPMSGTR
jgi:hypothetical protein